MMTTIINNVKILKSDNYNYMFNLQSGFFARWGKNKEDDPIYSLYGPEIADIEISNICNNKCPYCYKDNKPVGENMSYDRFTQIINKLNQNNQLTQVAFGLGATGEENPDLWSMCEYLRSINIIPNGTVANISDDTASRISRWFGACAVSYHADKDICYNSVKKLTDRGMKQVNIHFVVHNDNWFELIELFVDSREDDRLSGLNAIVILSLKNKGRAYNKFKPVSQEIFTEIVKIALTNNIKLGFDSCSYCKFETAIQDREDKERLLMLAEPCESFGVFSSYVNVKGQYFPCSFAEGTKDWEKGFDVLSCKDFIADIWESEKLVKYRNLSLQNNRNCILWNL